MVVYVYTCKMSGAEMFDNEDEVTELYNGHVLRIPSRMILDEAEEDEVKVNNVVNNFNYSATSFTKKDFMSYFKAYLNAVLEKLKEKEATEDEIAAFKKEAQAFFKYINEKFNDTEFYVTERGSGVDAATMGIGIWDEDCVEGPNFYYLKHGLNIVKM